MQKPNVIFVQSHSPPSEAEHPTDEGTDNSSDPPCWNLLFLLPIETLALYATSVPSVQCINRSFAPIKCIMFVRIGRTVNENDQMLVMGLYETFLDPQLNLSAERVVEIQNIEDNHGFGMKANLGPTDNFEDLKRLEIIKS